MSHGQILDEFVDDDYFAECDEHLAAARGVLLALGKRDVPTLELSELVDFASRLHAVKGLCGMIGGGLQSAEEVAQTLEDLVRAGVLPDVPISAGTIDGLFAGVTLVDRCVQSKRIGQTPPDCREFIERARALASAVGGAPAQSGVVATGEPPSRGVGIAIVPRPFIAAAEPAVPRAMPASPSVVRVELSSLDDLMRTIGEMILLRSRLDDSVSKGNGSDVWDDLRETNRAFERQLRTLREGVMRIRLVPVGEVFERVRYAMRDALHESGKRVRLELGGAETQIDKLIVDRVLEPLLHLVRNAARHGIESEDMRRARGKPAEGRITLRARTPGDRLVLETEDDGGGIDVEHVRRRASEIGITTGDRALSDEELLDVICAPGFSARASADMSNGREAGLRGVRSTVRAHGGELSLSTAPGQGTRFVLELPVTVMIADALLVEVGGQIMAVPQLSLREILQLEPSTVTSVENSDVISYRGSVLPLITLHRVFNMKPAADARPYVLVVGSDTQPTGLVVDRLIGLREIVVQPSSDPLLAIPGIAAASVLSDGRIGLIIDVAAVLRRARDTVGRHSYVTTPSSSHVAGVPPAST